MGEPSVRELLLADLDELIGGLGRALDAVQAITDQLEPDRAQSCCVAVSMTRVMLEEIQLRARARPIAGCGQ